MMKTTFQATLVALCTLCLAGCTDDSQQPEIPSDPQPAPQALMTMQADATEKETRANYTEDGEVMKFSWNNGDAISVYVDGVTENKNYKLTTTDESKSASFTGTVTSWDGTKEIYAVYPYIEQMTSLITALGQNKATAFFSLDNPQSYTIGGPVTNSLLVGTGTATASNTGDITASASMKQVMSFVKLNITNATRRVKRVELATTDDSFPTAATITLSSGKSQTSTSYSTNELTMIVTDNTNATTDKEIYFALFPKNLTRKDIQITVAFDDGTEKTIKKTGLDFKRNVHYVLEFNASGATLPNWDGTYTSISNAKILLQEESGKDSPTAANHIFHIYTAQQLAALKVLADINLPNIKQPYKAATYLLKNDIDLLNKAWEPIPSFTGTFNGQGHTISGLQVSGNITNAGLFATVDEGATVKNLMVKGDISSSKDGSKGGGIAGANSGTIEFCSFEGPVSAKGSAGGICGTIRSNHKITSCFVYSNTIEATKKGGIAGESVSGGLTDTPKVFNSTWYYQSGTGGIQACYSSWTSGGSNASFATQEDLTTRLDVMNNGASEYKWEQSGTSLKLVPNN